MNVTSTPSGLLATGGLRMDPEMIEQLLAYTSYNNAKRKKLPDSVRTREARKARKKARNHRKKFN